MKIVVLTLLRANSARSLDNDSQIIMKESPYSDRLNLTDSISVDTES